MKNLSEITDFYYKVLFPTLKELEKERKALRYRIVLVGVAFTFFMFIISLIVVSSLSYDVNILIFIGFVYLALGGYIYKRLIKDYSIEFKEKIIKPLIIELDSNLSYFPSQHISQSLFKKSKLFTSRVDRLSGNDFVKGKIDGVKIKFSDIHAEKREKNSQNKNIWTTVFQGLFIVAEFNKNFHAKTVVIPDTAQSHFGDLIGGWLQSNNFSREELVKMDNIEFEKEFVVYSNDQIEARYILSHTLMQRLLNFQRKLKNPVYISFIGDSIHIAIEYNKDLFEASVFHSLLEYKVAMEYVQTLHLAIGIIDELKLNQKLWSKQ
jgi:hypothetical protein